jgi:hypothetical protein
MLPCTHYIWLSSASSYVSDHQDTPSIGASCSPRLSASACKITEAWGRCVWRITSMMALPASSPRASDGPHAHGTMATSEPLAGREDTRETSAAV